MEYANMVVYEKSLEDKNLEGMGTTLEVCLIYNNKVFIGHIGDSRIYRIRKDFIRKLTQDHSYVQKLVQEGTITNEEICVLLTQIKNKDIKSVFTKVEEYDAEGKNLNKIVDLVIEFLKNTLIFLNSSDFFDNESDKK